MSSDIDVYADPADVVRRFIADMHDWESRMALAYEAANESGDLEPFREQTLATLGVVFARWCTPKERKHGRLGLIGLFCNRPRVYCVGTRRPLMVTYAALCLNPKIFPALTGLHFPGFRAW